MELRPLVKYNGRLQEVESGWEIIRPSVPKSGRGRLEKLVIYEKFHL